MELAEVVLVHVWGSIAATFGRVLKGQTAIVVNPKTSNDWLVTEHLMASLRECGVVKDVVRDENLGEVITAQMEMGDLYKLLPRIGFTVETVNRNPFAALQRAS